MNTTPCVFAGHTTNVDSEEGLEQFFVRYRLIVNSVEEI